MAKGHPDFFGIPIYPHFGSCQVESWGPANLAGLSGANLINIQKPGTIYGGWVRGKGVSTTAEVGFTLTVDGIQIFQWTLFGFAQYEFEQSEANLAYLTYYNSVDFEGVLNLKGGINFVSSYILRAFNIGVLAREYAADCYWAEII